MRRLALVAAVMAAACGRSSGPETTYVTVGADAVGTAAGVSAQVIATGGDIAIVEVPTDALTELSERMHEEHHRCGGFMAHDSLEDARAALVPAAVKPAPDYTLDRGDTVRAVLPKVSADKIKTTIGELSSMKNRYFQSESGAAASAWLRDRWRSYVRLASSADGSPREDITIELVDHGYPQKSVVMTIPGTTKADEVVVIGGHLDSISPGGSRGTAPGADDDASGIATLSEVARVLLAADFRPERTVKFMAYAAEEVGLRGSLRIAKDYQARGVKVVGALQLDMTNFQGSDRDIWLIDDHTDHDQNAFLVKLIESYTDATWGVDKCGYACSDHASWTRYGFRASMPFESRFKDSNRDIHTIRDTLERSDNNANHAVKFARLAAAYAIELGKGTLGNPAALAAEPDSSSPSSSSSSSKWPWIAGGAAMLGLLALLRRRR